MPDAPYNTDYEPDEGDLAALAACHFRGPLSIEELAQLLGWSKADDLRLQRAHQAGLLEMQGRRHAITQRGRDYLDRVLEGMESQLAPDDPAYVRRYRREAPTLPFDTDTIWAEAVCVNLRVRPEALRPLIPAVFDLDLHGGMAWVSLTASRLKDFGVGWVPKALRMNFYQATYRAHVTFTDFRGRAMRGCYFVRSETNSPLMSATANLLPEFKAHRCATHPILFARRDQHLLLSVDSGDDPAGKVVLVLDTAREYPEMPPGSLFATRAEARALIVDFYDAFAYDPDADEVFILKIDRGDWDIHVVEPVDHYLGYIQHGPFNPDNAQLDSVFYFSNCPYRWLPLMKEKRKGRSISQP
jgi:hypothetical protein